MANLDFQEMTMFAKWHGVSHLEDNPEFWADCLEHYHEKTVKLPLQDNETERDRVTALVKCPPGACGICCHYPKLEISQAERRALEIFGRQPVRTLTDDTGKLYLDISGGCQFLSRNACSVYEVRPATCRAFPILRPREAETTDGKKLLQMQMRLKCAPALGAIRQVITRACAGEGFILLPDLSLIPNNPPPSQTEGGSAGG